MYRALSQDEGVWTRAVSAGVGAGRSTDTAAAPLGACARHSAPLGLLGRLGLQGQLSHPSHQYYPARHRSHCEFQLLYTFVLSPTQPFVLHPIRQYFQSSLPIQINFSLRVH